VVEWLTNEEKADRFFVSRARGSERLAAASWEGFVGADGVPSPYLTKFLPTHLSETKRQSDLERLLLRYEWIQAKLRLTSVFALGSDYRRLSSDRSGPGRTVGEALELSAAALARNPAELPSQLHGRLRDFQQPEIQRLLTQAASGQNGVWLKPLTTDLTPPGTQLIATITQKGRGITSAVLNHDGSKAIYVNGDDVMMWKPLTGEEPLILCSASSPTLAVSEDGRLLAVSSQDGSVRVGLLCDDGFELQHTFAAVPPQITEISFSNKGASVTVILKDGRVFVLDLGAAKSVRQMPLTLQVQRGPFGSSALAGEIGILLFAASTFAEAIQCWDVNTGRLSRTIPLGTASSKRSIVSKLAVAPQADLFLVGGTDIQIWQRCNGAATLVRTIHGHEYIVSALAVAADRSRIISATSGFMALWDLARSGDTGAWTGRAEAWPKAIDIDTINRRASVIFNTLVAKIYDLDSSNQTSEEPAQPRPVAQATDGRELIGSQKKLVLHTPGSANTQIFQVEFDPSNGSAAFYPDGSCVVIGTEYSVRVFDVASGNITRKLEGDFYYGPTVAVALTNNGLRIAAPLEDNSVGLWDAVATTPVMVLHGHSYSVWSIVFCNGGARLITAGGDATIIIWDLTTGRQEATFTAHAGITCAACTPDNKLIVAGDLAGQVHFLDLMEGSAAELFSRHSP
jgi:WD40 repeat protein